MVNKIWSVRGAVKPLLTLPILWTFFASTAFADGVGTSGDPFTTLSDAYGVSSGRYYFNTGSGLFQADVDNDEGGGWVLALQYVHQGGTNPNTTVIGAGADFPVTSTAALGTDESLDTTQWGHAGNAAFSQFPEDIELRWYAETNAHARKIHFRSTVGDDYWRTGTGSVDGIATNFTSLTGHTANLPAAATNYGGGQGDSALTYEPYFQVNNYHWGINLGIGTRWEVDDYAANNAQDTIHRVWVRTTAPLEVTNTNNSGVGSLRQAITVANASTTLDAVTFNIDGSGTHIVTPLSALPTITDYNVSIDGTTQSDASCGQLTTGTQHVLRVMLDGNGLNAKGVAINSGSVSVKGLSIVGFGQEGVKTTGTDTVLECLYVGVEVDGTTGNRTASLIVHRGAVLADQAPNVIIKNNVISLATTRGGDGLRVEDSSNNAIITGNILGLDASGTLNMGSSDGGLVLSGPVLTGVVVGGVTAETRNIISGNDIDGVRVRLGASGVTFLGNYIGLTRDGTGIVANGGSGISFTNSVKGNVIGDGTLAGGNRISGNTNSGIKVTSTTQTAILGNSIYQNGGIGIDLNSDSTSLNDAGDADTGGNNLLNFPVINKFIIMGGTSISYDFNLDVPSHAEGYRIEFFKSTAADPTGYGEGEFYLGYLDVTHEGGDTNFTGTFTANQSLAGSDIISATTTRKTASGFDLTSEFSFATNSVTPTVLDASKSITIYDPLSEGLFSMPGNDVIYALVVTNPGDTDSDIDSIEIIDAVPSELSFYNGDMDEGGAEVNPVSFVQENEAGLVFTYATDVKYSNASHEPESFVDCAYAPLAGYDANVTYVCFNPKGAMAFGDPDPSFTLKFRARIK